MSFETPTPPPPGAPQAGPGVTFNAKALSLFDLIALGAGVLFFIFSFINRYVSASFGGKSCYMGYCAEVPEVTVGTSAWHSYAVAGLLIMLVALVLIALKALQPSVLPASLPWGIITAGVATLGWVLVLIRGLTVGGGASLGWSGWILVIVGLVVVAAAVIPLTGAAGGVEAKLRNAANQVGNHGGNTMPPPPGGPSDMPPPPAQ